MKLEGHFFILSSQQQKNGTCNVGGKRIISSSIELESIKLVINLWVFLFFHIFYDKNALTLQLIGYSQIQLN